MKRQFGREPTTHLGDWLLTTEPSSGMILQAPGGIPSSSRRQASKRLMLPFWKRCHQRFELRWSGPGFSVSGAFKGFCCLIVVVQEVKKG